MERYKLALLTSIKQSIHQKKRKEKKGGINQKSTE